MAHCVRQVRKNKICPVFFHPKDEDILHEWEYFTQTSADYVRLFSSSATDLLTPDSFGVILVKVFGLSSFLYRI